MFNIDVWYETNKNALIQTKRENNREKQIGEKAGIKKKSHRLQRGGTINKENNNRVKSVEEAIPT